MLWLVDVIILMVHHAVVDGIVWNMFGNSEGKLEQDPKLAATSIDSDLLSHIGRDGCQNITANKFDAL